MNIRTPRLSFWPLLGTASLAAGLLLMWMTAVSAIPQSQEAQDDPDAAGDEAVALESVLIDIHDAVAPSVVNIQVLITEEGLPVPGAPEQQRQGIGSGFVWDTEGHIVTNNHVIADATEITVTFMDGIVLPAEVVGTDRDSDLAVLRVDPQVADLQPIAVGDSEALRVGQFAVAIGNPFGLEGSMTLGIVSALGRALPVQPVQGVSAGPIFRIPDIVQTDASVNPGNSGGALVNIQGELIGVPTAIAAPAAGIGFAVSSSMVDRVVPELIEEGAYDHPYIGVSMTSLNPPIAREMDLPPEQRGALVVDVEPGAPADQAGIRGGDETVRVFGQDIPIGGDVITAIDDQPVQDSDELVSYLALNVRPSDSVTLTVLRNGEEETVEVTVDARPGDEGL